VDHSLLRRVEPVEGHIRYRMFESVRDYAAEKLASQTHGTALRHARYYARFGAEEFVDALEGPGGGMGRRLLALDLENLVAGVEAALASGELELAAYCVLGAAPLFVLKGPFDAGASLLARVLDGRVAPQLRARLHTQSGTLLQLACRGPEAAREYQQALDLFRAAGGRRQEGVVLSRLGLLHREQGRVVEALEHGEEALAIHRALGERHHEGTVLGNLGVLHHEQGRLLEAKTCYEQALSIHRDVGNRRTVGFLLSNLAVLHHHQGRLPEARASHEEALHIYRLLADRRSEGISLGNLGDLLFSVGEFAAAQEHFRRAIAIGDDVYSVAAGAYRGSLAVICALGGNHSEARTLLAVGATQLRGAHQFELAKLLCRRARVESLAGDPIAAIIALHDAETIAADLGVAPESELLAMIAELRTLLDGE
jgi:tetratricopeptide (TPR) repeat protein